MLMYRAGSGGGKQRAPSLPASLPPSRPRVLPRVRCAVCFALQTTNLWSEQLISVRASLPCSQQNAYRSCCLKNPFTSIILMVVLDRGCTIADITRLWHTIYDELFLFWHCTMPMLSFCIICSALPCLHGVRINYIIIIIVVANNLNGRLVHTCGT